MDGRHDRRSALNRRRELARLTKPELIDCVLELESEDESGDDCAACDMSLAECPMPAAGCCSDCTHAANYR